MEMIGGKKRVLSIVSSFFFFFIVLGTASSPWGGAMENQVGVNPFKTARPFQGWCLSYICAP